jgi:hypothetical protein
MRLSCVALADVPAARWDALTGNSFFASRGFLDLWSAAGGRPVAWLAETADGIAALLPGVEYGPGPLARFASLPDGCYGGLFVAPEREPERRGLGAMVLDAVARRRYARVCLYDFHRTLAPHPGFERAACAARLVTIGPGWEPADRKLQAQIRKGAREGARVERFDWARHHAGFFALDARTARQHGLRPRYSYAFYRALAELAERDERVMWLWCEHRGAPVAAQIYFVERGMLQAWQSYLDRSFPWLKAAQSVRAAACALAVERGLRVLNLGSTPPGAAGLARFKARWGGELVAYAGFERREGLGEIAAQAREPWGARSPARSPLPGAARP